MDKPKIIIIFFHNLVMRLVMTLVMKLVINFIMTLLAKTFPSSFHFFLRFLLTIIYSNNIIFTNSPHIYSNLFILPTLKANPSTYPSLHITMIEFEEENGTQFEEDDGTEFEENNGTEFEEDNGKEFENMMVKRRRRKKWEQ